MDKSIHSVSRTHGIKGEMKPEKGAKGKALPVRVQAQQAEGARSHRVVRAENDKVAGAVAQHISVERVARPIDLWQTYPTINLVEIREMREIVQLKRDLTRHLSQKVGPHVTEFDLSPFGLSRRVQVIGNVYVPIKRSEHLDIQSTLLRASPELGIKNGQAITFIIVEDELWDEVIPALHLHSATILALPETMPEKEEKKSKEPAIGVISKTKDSARIRRVENVSPKEKAMVVRAMMNRIAEEFYSKERSEEKKERERMKEEKCIKFAIEQYERLQKMVLLESKKHDFEEIVNKWEDSLPPFPIRLMRNSTLWRELKTKMIEGCSMR